MSQALKRAEIVKEFQQKEGDTGSVEVQVALLSNRITHLTDHVKANKKDVHTRYGLLNIVSQRGKLLKYLKKKDVARYRDLIKRLNIRDKY